VPIEAPPALTPEFGTDTSKTRQWAAFLKRGKLNAEVRLEQVCMFLNPFLMPAIQATTASDSPEFLVQ
jgi:hypothetical protein